MIQYDTKAFDEKYSYKGELGALYTPERTLLRVWAPTAEQMEVCLYGEDGEKTCFAMEKKEKGTWEKVFEGDMSRVYYTYNILLPDGTRDREIPDPYAASVGINGVRSQIVNMEAEAPEGWAQDRRCLHDPSEMEIYEVHIRDFSIHPDSGMIHKGKYLAFTERGTVTQAGHATGIDHLKSLGVTDIHLLPSFDFGSVDERYPDEKYNWGYDPVNYNAPEGSYSLEPEKGEVRIREFRQMVMALHEADLGVILDEVYNHTYDMTFSFNRLVPGYFHRPDSNGSFCGNDVASERFMVKKFIVDSVAHWARDYHIDGFRFDLMGLIDVSTMNAIRETLDGIEKGIFMYGEGWTMPTVPVKNVRLATQENAAFTPGIAYFSDSHRDAVAGRFFEEMVKGYVNGNTDKKDAVCDGILYSKSFSPSPAQTINYVSCHDNNTLWDKIRILNPDSSEETNIKRNILAMAIMQISCGVPFLMAGEEFLRTKTKEDGSFDENSFISGDSVNALDYGRTERYGKVLRCYRDMIRMRKEHKALRQMDPEWIRKHTEFVTDGIPEEMIAFYVHGKTAGDNDLFILINPTEKKQTIALPEGTWEVGRYKTQLEEKKLQKVSSSVNVEEISMLVVQK